MCCGGQRKKAQSWEKSMLRLRLVTAPFELFRRLRQKKFGFGFGFGDEKFEPKRFPTQLLSKSSKDESSVGQKAERLR